MSFWNRFKVKESKEYQCAKERIYKLHQDAKKMAYIDTIYKVTDETYEMLLEMTKGTYCVEDMASLFDCNGLCIGKIVIQEITIGKAEEQEKQGKTGETGKFLFQLLEGDEKKILRAQYLIGELA